MDFSLLKIINGAGSKGIIIKTLKCFFTTGNNNQDGGRRKDYFKRPFSQLKNAGLFIGAYFHLKNLVSSRNLGN